MQVIHNKATITMPEQVFILIYIAGVMLFLLFFCGNVL